MRSDESTWLAKISLSSLKFTNKQVLHFSRRSPPAGYPITAFYSIPTLEGFILVTPNKYTFRITGSIGVYHFNNYADVGWLRDKIELFIDLSGYNRWDCRVRWQHDECVTYINWLKRVQSKRLQEIWALSITLTGWGHATKSSAWH